MSNKDAEHRSKLRFLLQSAAALASTSVITAGLGFVFWAVAARSFTAADVGESSTAISAMNLLAPLTLLGFGTMLTAQLPRMADHRSTLVSTAAVVTGLFAGVVSLVCAALLPVTFLGLPGISTEPWIAVIFAAAVVTQAIGLLLDQALLSVIGGKMQLRRNAIQSVVKLGLLIAAAFTMSEYGSLAIFSSWLVANIVSILFVVVALLKTYTVPTGWLVPTPTALRGMQGDAFRHHALNTSLLVAYFAMPILANVTLGSEQAGYLYAAWSLAGFVFFIPLSLAVALFASGARSTATFRMEFRKTLQYSMVVCAAAILVMAVLGNLVLKIFGADYAENAHTALIILCVGGLGLVVKDHHVTLARVSGNVAREAVLVGVLSVLELAGAAFGALHGGLTGLTLGWLAAVGVGVLFYAPRVWREYRGPVDVVGPGS